MRRLALLMVCCVLLVCGHVSAADQAVATTSFSTWSPNSVTINVGEKVTWSNPTSGFHNVCVVKPGDPAPTSNASSCTEFRNGNPGSDWSAYTNAHTFTVAGTYTFVCQIHGISGGAMTGTITVDAANASIAGTVWHDVDGDGAAGGGDSGMSGVTVHLANSGGGPAIPDATTDANGAYSFAGLTAGNYVVTYDTPTNYGNTGPSQRPVTVGSGQAVTGKDFFTALAMSSIAGTVSDENGAGLEAVQVFADRNANGQPDQGEPSDATDATGAYTLNQLTPGTYHVSYVVPAGYFNSGTRPLDFSLAESEAATGKDFTATQGATVSGTVWNDTNGNGVADGGEAGISDVTVFLSITGDATPIADTSTNGAGQYSFTGIQPGTYHLTYTVPGGRDDSTPARSNLTLAAAQTVNSYDFFAAPGSATIQGVVRDDPNANHEVDSGEGFASGVVIGLDTDGDGVADQTKTTGTDGSYSFSGLTVRLYRVILNVPSGDERTGLDAAFDITPARGATVTAPDFFIRAIPPVTTPTQPTTTETPASDESPVDIDILGAGQGTNGDDLLNGSSKADKILGLGGDDLILGLGGNDLLDGGAGDDNLDGGAGNDRLFGRSGRDSLTGGPGDDKLFGGTGNDKLIGGTGNDFLDGGAGKDSYFGGPGDDTINSRDGVAEVVDCGRGKDKVTADKRDRLKGCEKTSRR